MIVSPSGFRAWPVQEWLHRDPHNEFGRDYVAAPPSGV